MLKKREQFAACGNLCIETFDKEKAGRDDEKSKGNNTLDKKLCNADFKFDGP